MKTLTLKYDGTLSPKTRDRIVDMLADELACGREYRFEIMEPDFEVCIQDGSGWPFEVGFRYVKQPLSAVANAMLRLFRQNSQAHEEIDMVGAPSECHGDAERGFERDRTALLTRMGWDEDELHEAVVARTSAKWAFANGF